MAVGPNAPSAGPVFPSSERDTERTSVMFNEGSRSENASIDAVTRTVQELSIPSTVQILFSSITSSLNLMATTFLGCMIFRISLFESSNAILIF